MRMPSTQAWSRLGAIAAVLAVAVCVINGARAFAAHDMTVMVLVVVCLAAVAIGALLIGRVQARRHARSIADRSAMLEQLASELSRANRAKGEFLANVSHELRTPLAAIVGFVEMLRDGAYGELTARQSGPVERIEASATHLQRLVDDILDLSRLAAARVEVHREPIALHAFVLNVAGELELMITEKALALSISVSPTLPRVRTDPTHLRQILVNLIANAIKYTPQGTVAIRARLVDTSGLRSDRAQLPAMLPGEHGVWIAVAVADTGIGIAEADHARVFDEFEQVDAGPRGDSIRRGAGLGLSISRRLAKLLNGDITLESTLGVGATFTLWLPVDPRDLVPRARSDRPGLALAAEQSLKP